MLPAELLFAMLAFEREEIDQTTEFSRTLVSYSHQRVAI